MNLFCAAISLQLSMTWPAGALSSGWQQPQPARPAAERAAGAQSATKKKEEKGPPGGNEAPVSPKSGKGPNLSELQRKGLDLAEQVGAEVSGISDRRNSALIQAVAADLLWLYRREQARELFRKAFETAVAYYQEPPRHDSSNSPNWNGGKSRRDVRVEILKLINKRDAELGREYNGKFVEAKKLEEEARAASSPQRRSGSSDFFNPSVPVTDGLIEAANSLIGDDVKLAAEMARRAVEVGVSADVSGFLFTLADRNRVAADDLYLYALEGLNSNPAPLPGELMALSAYPFGESSIVISDGAHTASWGFTGSDQLKLNPQMAGRFLATSLNALLRVADPAVPQSPGRSSQLGAALFAARALESKVAAHAPALQDQWQALIARLAASNAGGPGANTVRSTERKDAPPREAQKPPTVETLLERAQKTTNFTQRNNLYREAALTAVNSGDEARALEIAGRISDQDFRGRLTSWIHFEAALKAAREKRYDEARKHALSVEELGDRAYLFFESARIALRDPDRLRAQGLLEEAAAQAAETDETPEKVRILCGLAGLYLKIDQARSFNLAEAAVRAANKVPEGRLNPGEEDSQLVRVLSYDGNTHTNTINVGGFDIRRTFGELAARDFDRTQALAQIVENQSLRYRALIAVAESAFAK
ncbi:MAG TPA: hypothetical protein VJ302_33585, partial [Blastocatellia bacterium]|nr:hypothetical protein [Blastocatellia bacterium]